MGGEIGAPGSVDEFEKRLRRLAENLDTIKEQLEDVALDEMSEAHAYAEMAKECASRPDIAWHLFLIAADSILHRELAWAVLRAVSETQVLAREMLAHARAGGYVQERLEAMVEAHASIEEFAKSSYQGLAEYAEPGTTLRRLLEMLAQEEEKHKSLVNIVLRKIKGIGRG